jgi:hypothetical protein
MSSWEFKVLFLNFFWKNLTMIPPTHKKYVLVKCENKKIEEGKKVQTFHAHGLK